MNKSKTYKQQEVIKQEVGEPVAEYATQNRNQMFDMPEELLAQAVSLATEDVANGRCYTTYEVMAMLDRKMGWK